MNNKKTFSLNELASLTESQLVGNATHQITNVADLESATSEDASFLANPNYEKAMRQSQAGVIFISPNTPLIEGRNFLVTPNPSRAFQITVEAFLGDNIHQLSSFKGIHPTAVIHPSATIGRDVTIGPHSVIDEGVSIGDRTTICSQCYVGMHVAIGTDCYLHPHITIRERCSLGNRVILQPGVVIGSCGFGYTTNAQGHHTKLNQVGTVIIEDDVEIGANTTIDRSRFKATTIKRGSKIDNLVQIGHGVIVGEHNIIVAQSGIAGSTKTGSHVVIAGQVAIAGHLTIADRTVISGRSGVSKSITTPGGKYGGVPVMPLQEYNRNSVQLRNIGSYIELIKELEQRLALLEHQVKS